MTALSEAPTTARPQAFVHHAVTAPDEKTGRQGMACGRVLAAKRGNTDRAAVTCPACLAIEDPNAEWHLFERAGLGRAPFTLVEVLAMPTPEQFGSETGNMNVDAYNRAMRDFSTQMHSYGIEWLCSCHFCGMSIVNHFVIRSADRKHSVVGCDCIFRAGDAGLTTATKIARRNLGFARERAEYSEKRAQTQEERADYKEAENALMAWHRHAVAEYKMQAAAEQTWLVEALEAEGGFAEKIGREMRQEGRIWREMQTGRLPGILKDILRRTVRREAARGKKAEAEAALSASLYGLEEAQDALYHHLVEEEGEEYRARVRESLEALHAAEERVGLHKTFARNF